MKAPTELNLVVFIRRDKANWDIKYEVYRISSKWVYGIVRE